MRKLINFILLTSLFPIVAFASSGGCSPFSGFYMSGEIGWDYFKTQLKNTNIVLPGGSSTFFYGKENGFQGGGFLGWTRSFGMPHIGARVGYQAYGRAEVVNIPFVRSNRIKFRKMQSLSFDLLPGLRLFDPILIHAILGAGYGQYRLVGLTQPATFFRNQKRWAWFPRVGAGAQWAFWPCLTVGFEWSYQFQVTALYRGPLNQFRVQDMNERRVRARGNQFALTFNWYFF